jgi:RNA polymerase sigma factor (TIGR02999 family)
VAWDIDESGAADLGEARQAGRLTALLRRWSQGDEGALAELIPLVDSQLRRIASRQLRREQANPILDRTTALANEAYARLLGQQGVGWQSRAHFIGIAARIMRQVLVDHARRHRAGKRGGGADHRPLGEEQPMTPEGLGRVELLALHESLDRLADLDPRQARVVELRFFGGLTVEETAEVLDVSLDTVKRDWRNARLWLRRELAARSAAGS